MEPEGPFSRVERTLWTVWNYISDAVNRFLRPPPIVGVEARPGRESAGEPPETPAGREVAEGEPLVAASLPDSRQPAVTGDLCIPDVDAGQDGETVQRPQSSGESTESQPDQTRHDDAKEDEQKEIREETMENDEHEQILESGSQTLTDDVRSEEMEEEAAEKTVSVVTSHDPQEIEIQVTVEDEEEFDAGDIQGNQSTISLSPEEKDSMHVSETVKECEREVIAVMQEDAESCEPQVTSDQEEEPQSETTQLSDEIHAEKPAARSENDEDEEADEQITVTEREDINDDANSGMREEEREQENNLGEAIQEMIITCSDAPAEGAETWLQTPELTDKKQEEVVLTEVQSETDVKMGDVSADADPAEEECSEERETGQEVSGELESPNRGSSKGRAVVSEELNIPACEETQEGVPENNNESERDENTTQRFLEAGDWEGFQSAQLPEEVESKDQGNPENSRAEASLMSQSVEETQASTEDAEDTEDTEDAEDIADLVEHIEILHLTGIGSPQEPEEHSEAVNQEFGSSFEREITESSEIPMKTDGGNFRKDLELEFGPNEPLKELQDGAEKQLIEFGIDEFFSIPKEEEAVEMEPKKAEEVAEFTDENHGFQRAEAEIMTETSLFQEFVQESHETRILEAIPAPGNHPAESLATLLDEDITENLDAQQNMEVMSPIMSPFGAEHESEVRREVALSAFDLITGGNAEETLLSEQSEKSGQVKTEVIKAQSSHRGLEIRQEEDMIRDTETTDDLMKTEDLSEMLAEETTKRESKSEERDAEDTSSGIGGTQDVIDEEILDLWLKTATSCPEQQPNSQEETSKVSGTDLSEEGSDGETGAHLDHPDQGSDRSEEETEEKGVNETGSQENIEELRDTTSKLAQEADVMTSFCFQQEEHLQMIVSESLDAIGDRESGQLISVAEPLMRTETSSRVEVGDKPEREEPQPGEIAESAANRSEGPAEPTAVLEDQAEVDGPVLNFSPQRSRISVKNPRVRPPNNPRFLLNMPSVEPTPSPAVPVKPPAGVPLGGVGLGIKLPGFGSGFPVLKKTQRSVKNEDSQGTDSQEPETVPAGTSDDPSDAPKEDDAPHKPKWTPPKLPGFGNPLMSELKTKLKKTSDE